MSFVLKRDPIWLESHSLPLSDNSGTIILLSGDGGQVALPAALLLAASPLVRKILTEHLPPIYSQPVLSFPAVTGDVLQVVGDMLAAGTAADVNLDRMREVEEVFKMLMVEASVVCLHSEDISVEQVWGRKVKVEDCIAGTEVRGSDITINDRSDLFKIMTDDTVFESDNGKSPNFKKALNRNKQTENTENRCNAKEVQNKKSLKVFKCHICHKAYRDGSNMRRHIISAHPAINKNKKCTCQICFKTVTLGTFKHHLAVFHNDAEGSGEGSWIALDELEELQSTFAERSPDNNWQCSKCSYGSKTKSHVIEHAEAHIEGIHIACRKCEMVFRKRRSIRQHMKTVHPEPLDKLEELVSSLMERKPGNNWQCTKCGYGSKKKSHVKEHVKVHIEGIHISCKKCEMVFRNRSSVRYHMKALHPEPM